MKLKLKEYKVNEIKVYLKNTQLFFFFHGVNSTVADWIIVEQILKKLKLTHYCLTNNLVKIAIAKSILKNIKPTLKGPCFFIKLLLYKYTTLLSLQNLLNFTPLLTFFCLKINNKIYTAEQIHQLKTLNYLISIKNLQHFLQRYLYSTLKTFY